MFNLNDSFESYGRLMKKVGADPNISSRITQSVESERRLLAMGQKAQRASGRDNLSLGLGPRIVLPAAAFVLVLLCVALAPRLLSPKANHKAALTDTFVLTAYAEGSSTRQQEVVVPPDNFVTGSFGWSVGDDGELTMSVGFDLSSSGEGLQSATYSFSGDSSYLEVVTDNYDCSQRPQTTGYVKSYSALADESGSILLTANVYVECPANDEFKEASEALQKSLDEETSNEPDDEARRVNDARLYLLVAQRISEEVLTVEAKFYDGSTATQSYRIKPVDDFEERYQSADLKDFASLLTIERLS